MEKRSVPKTMVVATFRNKMNISLSADCEDVNKTP